MQNFNNYHNWVWFWHQIICQSLPVTVPETENADVRAESSAWVSVFLSEQRTRRESIHLTQPASQTNNTTQNSFNTHIFFIYVLKKGKNFPYSLPSVGPGADPGVQAVSPQVTWRHPPGGRLPLTSARPAVTFPAAEHQRPLAGTKLYCLVAEAHKCEQLAQGCYAALPWVGFEPTTCWSQVQRSTGCANYIYLLLTT